MTSVTSIEAASNAVSLLNLRVLALETALQQATSTDIGPESPLGTLIARVNALEARVDGYVASLSSQIVELQGSFAGLSASTTAKTDIVSEDIAEVRDLLAAMKGDLLNYVARDKLALTRDMVVRIMADEAARTSQT